MQPQSYLVISMTYPLPVLFVSNLLLTSYFIIADVNYGPLSAKFSDGNFKTVSMVRQPKQPSREQADVPQETSALPSTDDLFLCPQKGCVRVFQRFSALEQHLSLEACKLCPEKYSLLDLAKQEYASRLQEGTGLVPSLHFPASAKACQKEVQVTARCTRGRRGGQLLYSQRQSAFVPSCYSPYCSRSVRLVCLGKKQGNKEAENGFAKSLL